MDFLVSTPPACLCLPHPWLLTPAPACSLSHIPTLPTAHPGLNLPASLVLVEQLPNRLKHRELLAPSLKSQSGALHLLICPRQHCPDVGCSTIPAKGTSEEFSCQILLKFLWSVCEPCLQTSPTWKGELSQGSQKTHSLQITGIHLPTQAKFIFLLPSQETFPIKDCKMS